MDKYEIRKGKVYRKKYFCEKYKRFYREKQLKIQNINGYEYVYINCKLVSLERLKMSLI